MEQFLKLPLAVLIQIFIALVMVMEKLRHMQILFQMVLNSMERRKKVER